MKKVFISLVSAALLFTACGSDEEVSKTTGKTGDLHVSIDFDGLTPKAASLSAAIPVTGWSNINKVQMFLYNASDGKVAFSAVINPSSVTGTNKTFQWANVPVGTYQLALVANIKSDEDNIATFLDGGISPVMFDAYNVKDKNLNTQVFIDLKKKAAFPSPTNHTFPTGAVAYAPSSELFTAYAPASVTIAEGVPTDLTATPLQLKREISLFRVRIDKTNKPASAPALNTVSFSHTSNFIAIYNMPKGIGLKVGSFAGGIYDTPSEASRIMIGAEGVGTFIASDPTSGYSPATILDTDFTLWNDIRVLPNASKAEGKASSDDAAPARKYFIVISGWAPAGYEYADGTTASVAQPVYWSGTVNGVFSPNVIREVNLTISSKGYTDIPGEPDKTGGLDIVVGAPELWNSVIEREDKEI